MAFLWRIEWGWDGDYALLQFCFDEDDARWLVGALADGINRTQRSPNGDRGVAAIPVPRKDGPPRAYRLQGLDRPAWLRARRVEDTA